MIKKVFARILSEVLYYLGHWISFPMHWFGWAWLYPIYNRLMSWSSEIQDWAGNELPWRKVNDKDS
jgi:hypothetical protein